MVPEATACRLLRCRPSLTVDWDRRNWLDVQPWRCRSVPAAITRINDSTVPFWPVSPGCGYVWEDGNRRPYRPTSAADRVVNPARLNYGAPPPWLPVPHLPTYIKDPVIVYATHINPAP